MTRSAVNRVQDVKPFCTPIIPTRRIPDLIEDARSGLLNRPRHLPPKYFYDDLGSELFEQICATEDYYPTRTEDALLTLHGGDIIARTLPEQIIELGSGSSRKTRRLFDACQASDHECNYTPIDVCEAALTQAVVELNEDYRWLDVTPMTGDYHAGLGNLPHGTGTSLYVFLGSTIGNFKPRQAKAFMQEVCDCMKPDDWFLLGVDMVKDNEVLTAAYNDSEGVTAQFNLNVLSVLNRELHADFDPALFTHEALFNEDMSRIEMYLRSLCEQDVHLGMLQETIHLQQGERILTELSHKFTPEKLGALLQGGGLELVRQYQPENRFFSLVLARRPA
jgi:L-histidine N-alpha-methyltransferase